MAVAFAENSTDRVTNINTDDTGLTYTLEDPAPGIGRDDDNALFNIDENTGVLTFKSPPDFEDPEDASKDNIYLAEVTARNLSFGTVMKVEVRVSVTNVIGEPPTVVTEISSPLLVEGFDAYDIDLSGTFKDDDGDGLVRREYRRGHRGDSPRGNHAHPYRSRARFLRDHRTANDGNGGMASAMFTVTVSRLFITTWNTGPDKSIIIPTGVLR